MCLGVHFENREREETKGAVGQGASRMAGAFAVGEGEGEQFKFVVALHVDLTDVFDEFGKPVGYAGVDGFGRI